MPRLLAALVFAAVVAVSVRNGADAASSIHAEPRTPSTLRPVEDILNVLASTDPHWHYDEAHATDTMDARLRAQYYGMQAVLSDTLQHQFLGLSNDALRREWLRRYWALRDPTPTTPENERFDAHQRRVEVARGRYRWSRAPYYDERGRIYIQFGEPDNVARTLSTTRMGLGFVPTRETWTYAHTGRSVAFEQSVPGGAWVVGLSSARQTNRRDILYDTVRGDVDHRVDEDTPELSELAPDARQVFFNPPPVGPPVPDTGIESFTLPGPPRRFMPYAFDADAFRGDSTHTRVEVHVQFDVRKLKFQGDGAQAVARYRVEGVLLDDSVRVAARAAYDDSLQFGALKTTLKSLLWPGQLDFEVPAGSYRLALRVLDLQTLDEGTYATDVRVPGVARDRLGLSDLEIASRIETLQPDQGSRFAKGDRVVVPHPIGVYRRDQALTGYFEIYGLQRGGNGKARYEVTYTLIPKTKERPQGFFPGEARDKPVVSSSFVAEGDASDAQQDLRIDIAALDPDDYGVLLTVKDLVAHTEATTRTHIRVAP